jgi:hypothetical protein
MSFLEKRNAYDLYISNVYDSWGPEKGLDFLNNPIHVTSSVISDAFSWNRSKSPKGENNINYWLALSKEWRILYATFNYQFKNQNYETSNSRSEF